MENKFVIILAYIKSKTRIGKVKATHFHVFSNSNCLRWRKEGQMAHAESCQVDNVHKSIDLIIHILHKRLENYTESFNNVDLTVT